MRMRMAWLIPALFVTLAGCRPADQRTDSVDPQAGVLDRAEMTPEVVAQLDSGSQAFRNDDFELALRHYTSVTELAPDVGAGWFGVYMAQQELGNEDEARAALERARSLVPGATLIHADSGG